jgi:tetratricopeptide (TPR) repeat protein
VFVRGGRPFLLPAAPTTGALAQPSLRRKAEDLVGALAERNRWNDILALTESLAQDVGSVPPGLVRWRAGALRRAGRDPEARDLLIRLAKGNRAERRVDPATLYQLADLLAKEGSYDAALKLVAKADSLLPYEADGERLRQLQLEKRLAASFSVHRSAHFEIRYPPTRETKFAKAAAEILEAERRRLQAWIPLNSSRVTIVHLLPFEDFRMGYSPDMGILGLYDGEIRLPLGNVRRFVPFIVTLLSHELAHAMIAEATGDQAPRWFHEGLAQHIEMLQDNVNPIPGYRSKGNLLGFPLIEPAIGSYSSALATIGYDESRWAVHYIEQRHGRAGIQRMLAAFRDGKTTEEALESALGTRMAEFDRALWEWGSTEAPDVWKVELVRYDEE